MYVSYIRVKRIKKKKKKKKLYILTATAAIGILKNVLDICLSIPPLLIVPTTMFTFVLLRSLSVCKKKNKIKEVRRQFVQLLSIGWIFYCITMTEWCAIIINWF